MHKTAHSIATLWYGSSSCVFAPVYVCICVSMHVRKDLCEPVHIRLVSSNFCVYENVFACVYVCVCLYVCVHVCACMCVCVCVGYDQGASQVSVVSDHIQSAQRALRLHHTHH